MNNTYFIATNKDSVSNGMMCFTEATATPSGGFLYMHLMRVGLTLFFLNVPLQDRVGELPWHYSKQGTTQKSVGLNNLHEGGWRNQRCVCCVAQRCVCAWVEIMEGFIRVSSLPSWQCSVWAKASLASVFALTSFTG